MKGVYYSMNMDKRIVISKKNAYIIVFFIFVLLMVLLSQLALRSNQANNSKASEINKSISVLPTAPPPNCALISCAPLDASINSQGEVEFINIQKTVLQFDSNLYYSIYMYKNNSEVNEVHITTFKGASNTYDELFSNYKIYPVINAQNIGGATFKLFTAPHLP